MAMNKFLHASNRENLAIIQQYFYGQNIHSIQDWYAKGKVSDIYLHCSSKKEIDLNYGGIINLLEDIFPKDEVCPWQKKELG